MARAWAAVILVAGGWFAGKSSSIPQEEGKWLGKVLKTSRGMEARPSYARLVLVAMIGYQASKCGEGAHAHAPRDDRSETSDR
jgi:hypothetical protein